MNYELLQTLLTAGLSAGGAWLAVHAELRALWRSHEDMRQRLGRLESKAMEV